MKDRETLTGSLYTTARVAELAGISPHRVRQFIRDGRLHAVKVGGKRIIDERSALAFLRVPRPTGRPPKSKVRADQLQLDVEV